MNIFSYFDEDITVRLEDDSFNDSIEEPIIKDFPKITPPSERKVPSSHKAPGPSRIATIKTPLRELSKNTFADPKSVTPGRLNKNLLKIFESETYPPNNATLTLNPLIIPNRQQHIALPRKAPIMRNKIDQLVEPRKKVDNEAIVGPKPQAARETSPLKTSDGGSSTVKIANASRKVDSPRPIPNPNSAKSVNHRERDKCFVRNINDLFLHYRTQQQESCSLDQHQVNEAIQQLEKPETSEPLKLMEDQPETPKPSRKKSPEETAQQIHFRLQNQTYRLQMRNLIDSQNFIHMSPSFRNQLFHLDKIFNRSNLSLIHMVLSLINENVLMGDRVSLELHSTDYDRFVDTMSEGSYGIDSMATSTIRENCVAVEILAVDDPASTTASKSSIKIVILFVIEMNGESSSEAKRLDNECGQLGQLRLDSDFLITVRMRFEPPENELQKSHETGTNLSEHQLRVQASLQRLNIPDWYKQYSGKDGVTPNQTAPNATTSATGGILRKRNSDVGRWTGLSSKTTSLSSLGSHRSDRSPVMLSPSAHSHHGGQTGFSRWSTSHLNSNQTSPSVSTRGSFTRGGLNASVISGYSTASTTAGATAGHGVAPNSAIRNSFRQPYLGWRSQEKLAQPRTPAERLASSLLSQQKLKEQQQQKHHHQHQNQQKVEPVVTPEIQSSIKEVTSAIVHYVNDQTNRHSRSRSTSPSQRCWLESSFVGTKPLDSPQTPMIDNSSSGSAAQHVVIQQHQHISGSSSSTMAGDHYRYNAGRMNGVGESTLI
ncbi:hypothetical protein RP20_CCG016461 [Aedes albopictus]|nr:hypothetical protein RP20_CCG016461 [Aedes albopictus]